MILSCGAALMAANRFGSVREAVAVSELAIRWLDSDDDGGGAEGRRALHGRRRICCARWPRGWSALVARNVPSKPCALRCGHSPPPMCSAEPACRAHCAQRTRSPTQPPKERLRRRRERHRAPRCSRHHPSRLTRRCSAALPPSASTAKAASASAAAAPWRLRASAFLTDEAFARRQLLALRSDAAGQRWAGALATLLAATATGRLIKPTSSEARRRLKSFAGSLALPMPAPPPVACMRSVSFLTPVYAETVIFSLGELCAAGPDGRQAPRRAAGAVR